MADVWGKMQFDFGKNQKTPFPVISIDMVSIFDYFNPLSQDKQFSILNPFCLFLQTLTGYGHERQKYNKITKPFDDPDLQELYDFLVIVTSLPRLE